MDHGHLPSELVLDRTTDVFTEVTVPAGLLRAHRVARGVWGRLVVREGRLRFVWEAGDADDADDADDPVELVEGDSVVIPPEVPHRVEPAPGCRFVVEFHR